MSLMNLNRNTFVIILPVFSVLVTKLCQAYNTMFLFNECVILIFTWEVKGDIQKYSFFRQDMEAVWASELKVCAKFSDVVLCDIWFKPLWPQGNRSWQFFPSYVENISQLGNLRPCGPAFLRMLPDFPVLLLLKEKKREGLMQKNCEWNSIFTCLWVLLIDCESVRFFLIFKLMWESHLF